MYPNIKGLIREYNEKLYRLNLCMKARGVKMVVYLTPVAQHFSSRLPKPDMVKQFNLISRQYVVEFNEAQKKFAIENLGLEVLEGDSMSDARWWSTHDGIHYTLSVRMTESGFNYKPGEGGEMIYQWQGGVSAAVTHYYLSAVVCGGEEDDE